MVTLVLNVVMMGLAYLIARLFASGAPQQIAISLECGLQNGTLAIAVAALLFDGGLARRAGRNLQPDHVRDGADIHHPHSPDGAGRRIW